MDTVARGTVRIDGNVTDAQTKLRSVSNEFKRLNSSLVSMTPGATVASKAIQRLSGGFYQLIQGTTRYGLQELAEGLGKIVKQGYDTASTMESAAVAFKTLLPPTEDYKNLLTEIEQAAVKTPFDVGGLAKSTQRLVMVTQNGKEAERTVLNLGKAVIAAGRGDPELTRMATNLQQIGANAFVSARDIREFGNAGIDILGLVSERTGKAKDEVQEWLQSIGNPYEVIADAINAAGEGAGKFANVYVDSANTMALVTANLSDSIGIFGEHVLKSSGILDKFKEILKAVSTQVSKTSNIGTVAEAFGKLVQNIDAAGIATRAMEGLFKVFAAFNAGQFNNIAVFFKELFNTLRQFSGVSFVGNTLKVILDLFSDNHTAEEVAHVAHQIGNLIRTLLELGFAVKVSQYFYNLGIAAAQLTTVLRQTTGGVNLFSGALKRLTAHPILLVVAAISALVTVLATLNPQGFQNFINSIAQGFAQIGNFIGGIVQSFLAFGQNIIVGLWNGLVNGFNAVIGKIKEMAIAIRDTFKHALGIHSPSRVMRDEVGVPIAEGIAAGIEAGTPTIDEAMRILSDRFGLSGDELVKAANEVLEKLASLQDKWLGTLNDYGAINMVEQINLLRKFANQYAENSKARIALDEKVADLETNINKQIINLVETFNKEFTDAVKKAKEYYNLFEYTQATLTRTTSSVLEGLRRQNKNMSEYYKNLAMINQMGFDADFLKEIAEQGMDAASEVAGLSNATQEQIEEINRLWRERGSIATDIAKENTQSLREETLAEIDYLQSGLDTRILNVYDSGTLLVEQFTSGIYDTMPTIETAIRGMADSLESATRAASSAGGAAADAASELADVGDVANYGAGEVANYAGEMGKLDVQAFDTANVFDLFKNILSGIPWYQWVLVLGMLASGWIKTRTETKNTANETRSAMSTMAAGISSIDSTLQAFGTNIARSLQQGLGALEKFSNQLQKTYYSMFQISNYDSVFRQATQGMLGFVGEAEQQVIHLVDFTRGQYSSLPKELRVSTKEATAAIADVARNGLTNISETTRRTLDKVQSASGLIINTAESAAAKNLDIIDYHARDMYQSIIHGVQNAELATKNLSGVLSNEVIRSFGTIEEMSRTMISGTANKIQEANYKIAAGFYDIQNASASADRAISSQFSQITNYATAAGNAVRNSMNGAMDGMKVKINGATLAVDQYANSFSKVSNSAASVAQSVNTSLSSALDTSKIKITGISQAMQQASKESAKAAKQAAKEAQVSLFDSAEKIKQKTKTIPQATAAVANQVVNQAKTTTASVSSQIDSKLGATKARSLRTFYDIGNGIEMGIMSAGSSISMLGSALDGVAPGFAAALSKIGGTLDMGFDTISNSAFGKVRNGIQRILGIFPMAGGVITNFMDQNVKTPVSDGIDKVTSTVTSKGTQVANGARGVFGKIKDVVRSGSDGITKESSNTVDKVTNNVSAKSSKLVNVVSKVTTTISGVVNALGNIIFDVADNIATRIMGLLNTIAKGVTKVLYTLLSGLGQALAALLTALSDPLLIIGAGILLGIAAAVWLVADAAKLLVEAVRGAILTLNDLIDVLVKMSEVGDRMNFVAIAKVGLAVNELGLILSSGLVTNITGAISSGFAVIVVSAFKEITQMLLDVENQLKTIESISVEKMTSDFGKIVAILWVIRAGFSGTPLGAIMDMFRSWQSGSMVTVVSNVEEITNSIVDIESKLRAIDNISPEQLFGDIFKIVGIINALRLGFSGTFLGAIADFNRSWQSGSMNNVASNIDEIVSSVIDIENKLSRSNNLDPNKLVEDVKKISEMINALRNGFGGHFWNAIGDFNRSLQSGSMSKVAENVEKIVGTVINIENKLRRSRNVSLTQMESDIKQIGGIVNALREGFGGHLWNAFADMNRSWQSSSLSSVAHNLDGILGAVQSMCHKMQEFGRESLSADEVERIVREDIGGIVGAISSMFSSDFVNIQSWKASGKANIASALAEMTSSIDTVLGTVQSMCNKLKEFNRAGYAKVDDITKAIDNIKTIAGKIAEIDFSQTIEKLEGVTSKTEQLQNISSHLDSMLGAIQSICYKFNEFNAAGYANVNAITTAVNNLKLIAWQLAEIDFSQSIEKLESVTSKSEQLKGIASNLEGMLGSIQSICNKFIEFNAAGYGNVESITTAVNNTKLIAWKIAEIDFSQAIEELQDTSSQTEQLKNIASNLSSALDSIKHICDTLKAFNDAGYGDVEAIRTVVENVKQVAWKLAEIDFSQTVDELTEVAQQSEQLKNVASNLDALLGTIKNICDKFIAFQQQGYSPDGVKGAVDNARKVAWAVADINFRQSTQDFQYVTQQLGELQSISEAVNKMLEIIKVTVERIQGLGVTPEQAIQGVRQANAIVAEIGRLALPNGTDGAYQKLAESLGALNTAIGTVVAILDGCRRMFDAIIAFSDAYSLDDIAFRISHVNDILWRIAGPEGLRFPDDSAIDSNMVEKLSNTVTAVQKVREIAEALNQVPEVAAERLAGISTIIEFIKTKMSELPAALANYTNDFTMQGTSYAQAFINGWNSQLGSISEAGHQAQTALWSAIQSHMQDEYYQGAALANEVANGIRSKLGDFQGLGAEVQGRFWSGIQTHLQDEFYQGQALSNSVVDGIWSKQSDWWWSGDEVAAGFAGGINRTLWRVNEAAGNLSETAINKLRELLRISSPSKVMMQLGEYVTIGLAEGIEESLSEVESAGEALAQAIMNGYSDTIEPLGASIDMIDNMRESHGLRSNTAESSSTGNNVVINQENNIYNDADTSKITNDLMWAIARA